MKQIYKFISIFSMGLAFTACDPELDDVPNPEPGQANFSKYVALGNSLTAGFSDAALYRGGQENSFPAILAMQFAEVGGGDFKQPLVPEGPGIGSSGAGRLVLTGFLDTEPPTPVLETEAGDFDVFGPPTNGPGPYNNLGVPGANVEDLLSPSFAENSPFYARFATNPGTSTVVGDAVDQDPTFFTLWIGNNDVLGFATSGGEGDSITSPALFQQSISGVVGSLKQADTDIKGAVANIIDITGIPFFNTVPWNAFALESQGQVDQLTAGFAMQIDPAIDSTATAGVILQAVTQQAVLEEIIPPVAEGAVKLQIASTPPCNATPDPEACAEAVIASGQADASIEEVRLAISANYFLPGNERADSLQTAYNAVDSVLALPETQAQIQEGFEQTKAAFDEGQLPPEQQTLLQAAIDSVFNANVTQLKAANFYPEFEVGANGFVVAVDPEVSPTGLYQLTENEKMLLTFLQATPEEFNPDAGLVVVPDKFALDPVELSAINNTVVEYNTIIESVAGANGLALVDIAKVFKERLPFSVDGRTFTSAFISGNVFSLDGVHPTQAGYAIVADEFIKAINATYGSTVPRISNFNQFKGVIFGNNSSN